MTVVRQGLSRFSTGISNAYGSIGGNQSANMSIGVVFGVITTPNTPTPEIYEKNGGSAGIGTIFYLEYNNINKNKKPEDVALNTCLPAKPLFPFVNDYPLEGEIVILFNAPSPDSQNSPTAAPTYYLPPVNLWNSPQHNSPVNDKWKTFIQSKDIKSLLSFEGDRIYQGRKGNGIRFGTTVKLNSDLNEWSSVGNDGDPITILANGYATTDSSSPHVEEINKEKSSIYLTATQKLPLQPGASIVNPRVNTIKPNNYYSSQIIMNSDRITLNAKKDEVLLFAKGNIELNTDNIININAGRVTHINSPSINLGTKPDGSYPTEPAVLGGQLVYAFDILIGALSKLASSLTSAAVPTTEGGIAIPACKDAGTQLFADLSRLCDQVEKCTSTKVYTA